MHSRDGPLKVDNNLGNTQNMLIICQAGSKYTYGGYSSNTKAFPSLWPD